MACITYYEATALSGPDLEYPVGTMSLYAVDLARAHGRGFRAFEVLDCLDSTLERPCTLISRRAGMFVPPSPTLQEPR